MSDIVEGVVVDVVHSDVLVLAVEHVEASDAARYHRREWVLPTAPLATDLESRRVRCHVRSRDDQGRLVGIIEVLPGAREVEPYGPDEQGE